MKKRKALKDGGIDYSKLSPELKAKITQMEPEEVRKFLAWLKEHKG